MKNNGNNQNDIEDDSKPLNSYAKYTGVAFQMMAIIGVFAFIGYKLDIWFKTTTPWITALCCIIGVCLSLYQTIRQLK